MDSDKITRGQWAGTGLRPGKTSHPKDFAGLNLRTSSHSHTKILQRCSCKFWSFSLISIREEARRSHLLLRLPRRVSEGLHLICSVHLPSFFTSSLLILAVSCRLLLRFNSASPLAHTGLDIIQAGDAKCRPRKQSTRTRFHWDVPAIT